MSLAAGGSCYYSYQCLENNMVSKKKKRYRVVGYSPKKLYAFTVICFGCKAFILLLSLMLLGK